MKNENTQESTQGQLKHYLILTDIEDCEVKKKFDPYVISPLNNWLHLIESNAKPAVVQKYKDKMLKELLRIINCENVYKIYLCTASKRISKQERIRFYFLLKEIGQIIDYMPCKTKKHRE